MRIAEIIGTVTLSRWHPSVNGATWKLGVPLAGTALRGDDTGRGEPFVIYDELGASMETRIAVSESAEASAPFYPDQKPIDAYNAAILDHIDIPS